MENLRATVEYDLATTIEGEWKVNVELTNPDGVKQVYSKNNPTTRLGGQVLYFTRRIDPATGEAIIADQPVVTLRNSSLDRIPAAGETWYIKFPVSPVPGAPLQSFVFTPDRAPEHGTDIGFTRIYPERLSQDGDPIS